MLELNDFMSMEGKYWKLRHKSDSTSKRWKKKSIKKWILWAVLKSFNGGKLSPTSNPNMSNNLNLKNILTGTREIYCKL